MRRTRRALLLLACLLPGCLDAPDNAAPGEDAAPAAPAARGKLDLRFTHDHTEGRQRRETFEVPAGAGRFDLTLSHHPLGEAPAGACANVDARIRLLDPAGRETFAFGGPPTASPGLGACSTQPNADTPLSPGVWTVVFSGAAPMRGLVEVRER